MNLQVLLPTRKPDWKANCRRHLQVSHFVAIADVVHTFLKIFIITIKKPPGDYQRLLLSSRASSLWSNLELFLRCVPFITYIIVVLALSLSLSLGCVFLIIYRVSKKK